MDETKTEHTPGPWTIEPIFGDDDLSIVLGYPLPEAGSPVMLGNACGLDDHGLCPATVEEAKANARLMAAAPDLLEACRAAEQFLYPGEGRYAAALDSAIDKLHDAIAKATG